MTRTHKCNELRIEDDKKTVVLIGWAQRIRDHGGKKFIDLRDKAGLTQIVFDPDVTSNFAKVEGFRREYLIEINGEVRPRPQGTINKKHETGEIEILVKSFEVINESKPIPFDIDEDHKTEVSEEIRLEYRYLDLRKKSMQNIMIRKHKFYKALRDYMDSNEFIEFDTPSLTKSTPEGARDFLVPFRKKAGHFFALPQSPQLFKQLLMVSGIERYYQIATCFRDEDLRKDRQYEHKQLDMEMSFVSKEESFKLIEKMFSKIFKDVYDVKIPSEFKILTYKEVMDKYGCDKPDLRINGLELVDISDIAKDCGFSVFKGIVERSGLVKGMRVEKGQELISRKNIDKLIKFCQENGAKGMAYMKVVADNKIESSIAKFFSEEELNKIRDKLNGSEGDLLFFIADEKDTTNSVLDALRRELANKFNFIDKTKNEMLWVTQFPLFKWDNENNKLDFEHNPFTMPLKEEDIEFLLNLKREDLEENKEKLLSMVSDCYDLVFNGTEISSGAARIYKPQLQMKMFELVDFSKERVEESFGWFLKAYDFGAPPHRGFGFGLERIVMMLENKESIREVIPFPRNKHGHCPLTNSPSDKIDKNQIRDLNLTINYPKKEN